MKKRNAETPKEQGPKVTTITNIAMLVERIRKPIEITFALDGEVIRLPARRLMDDEEAKIQAIMHELGVPPVDKETKEYNFRDAKFQAKQAQLQDEQVAVRIYTGVPSVEAGKPGLTSRSEIRAYVSGLFPRNIREIINGTLELGGVGVVERVNFTSTPDSAES